MMDLQKLLEVAMAASKAASLKILEVYGSEDFDVEVKNDNSPLTRADKASHEIICEFLQPTGFPILSEEGKNIPFEERKLWNYFWMVDPIDGTKEFIKRNGEFTVNIALIKGNAPILGVVQVPVSGDIYTAIKGNGAYKNEVAITISKASMSDQQLRVVASRSHMNDDTSSFVSSLNDPITVSKGSSLKLLMVAEGEADLYPRFAPTMEWDTAAAQIVVEEAGGKVLQKGSTEPVSYNKENLLNPHFLVKGTLQSPQ